MVNIEKIIGLLAGILIGSAQLIYLFNTCKKVVTPSVLSWFGWACLMGTSLVSQILGKGWQWSQMSILCSTAGCVAIATTALLSNNYSWNRRDLRFLFIGLACVIIYLLSDNAWITTIFAVIADAALGIPTLQKAYTDPASERSPAWLLGVISSTLALIICIGHDAIYTLFPGYLFLFNGAMVYLTRRVSTASMKC